MKQTILLLFMGLWALTSFGQADSVLVGTSSLDSLDADSVFADTTKQVQSVKEPDWKIVRIVIAGNDTFYVYDFDKVIFKEFTSKEERLEYLKLVRRIKKVMPYAKLAAFRLQMMEDNLSQLKTRRAKKKYIKQTEKAIKKEFMDQIKNLYVEEGKLLLKLIHRETGTTTFEILKKYRGNATTFYWGMMAKAYDADLKVEYDPIRDYWIDHIIKNLKLE